MENSKGLVFSNFTNITFEEYKTLNNTKKAHYRTYIYATTGLLFCGRCGKALHLDKFKVSKRKPYFKRPYCHECELDYSRSKKERTSELHKLAYVKKREALLEYQRNYRKNNRAKIATRDKAYREKNKEGARQYSKKYYKENKDRLVAYGIEYVKKRRREDPYFRMKILYRKQLWRVFQGNERTEKSEKLLGCTYSELLVHLNIPIDYLDEAYELDHIIPIEAFDIRDISEIKLCSHYSNLQLLPLTKNRRKGDLWQGIRWRHIQPDNKRATRIEILENIGENSD